MKFYEAGMDMGWSANATESFRIFQSKVLEEYDRIVPEYGLQVVDATAQHHRAAAAVPRAWSRAHLESNPT